MGSLYRIAFLGSVMTIYHLLHCQAFVSPIHRPHSATIGVAQRWVNRIELERNGTTSDMANTDTPSGLATRAGHCLLKIGTGTMQRLKTSVENYIDGCAFMYENWRTALSRIFWSVTFKGKMGLGLACLVAMLLLAPEMYKMLLVAIYRVLIGIKITCNLYMTNWLAFLSPLSFCLQKTLSSSGLFVNTNSFVVSAVFIVPLQEEIMFRWGCDLFCDLKKYRKNASQFDGVSPELCFSILFGACHVGNYVFHTQPFAKNIGSAIPTAFLQGSISAALLQGFLTYRCSRLFFFPAYRKFGLMGSTAAHMVWNATMFFLVDGKL